MTARIAAIQTVHSERGAKMGIELEQAVDIIRANISPCKGIELATIDNLTGRICAQDVFSPIGLPPFHRSPLDGYALRAADSAGASKESPVSLTVMEEITAGHCPRKSVEPGTAIRLMTGAPIPEGADCVIRQEETDMGGARVRLFRALAPFENFCHKGEDIALGALLVGLGDPLSYVDAGILAGAGVASVSVYRKPRVLLLDTGDELWDRSRGPLPSGKIFSSNHALLSARLRAFGVQVLRIGPCPDESAAIAQTITDVARDGDLVITTGGVSVGCKDLLPEAMAQLGADILFHGVNLKPGTPAMFSLFGGLPILSLSGNPFAAITTMELLARPALAILSRNKGLELAYGEGILQGDFPKASPGRRFIRAFERDGAIRLPVGLHASGVLGSMRGCNCLLDIPAGTGPLKTGDKVRLARLTITGAE